ncbi:MAG: hypothetical protein AAGI52_06655 [Bacteroidota bacterium]
MAPPPAPTLDQAGLFFRLLCDLGYADALDELHQAEAPRIPMGKSSLAEAAGVVTTAETDADGGADPVVRFDLGEIFRQIGRHGAFPRLGAIIWNTDEDKAGGIEVSALREAFLPFAVACVGPLRDLEDFVRSLA